MCMWTGLQVVFLSMALRHKAEGSGFRKKCHTCLYFHLFVIFKFCTCDCIFLLRNEGPYTQPVGLQSSAFVAQQPHAGLSLGAPMATPFENVAVWFPWKQWWKM